MESQMVKALLENHFYLQKKEWSDFTEMRLTTVRLLHYMQGLEEYKKRVVLEKIIHFLFLLLLVFFFIIKAAAYPRKFNRLWKILFSIKK